MPVAELSSVLVYYPFRNEPTTEAIYLLAHGIEVDEIGGRREVSMYPLMAFV